MVQTLSQGSASRSGAIRSNALHTLFTTIDILAEIVPTQDDTFARLIIQRPTLNEALKQIRVLWLV
jgi:hypothetical protein